MNNKRRKPLVGCRHFIYGLAVCLTLSAQAADKSLPAFPGAEGFGAFTPGGRGGQVLLVTTLEDYDSANGDAPIPGSFRQAVQTRGPRLVLFRASGTIFLKARLRITEPFLTLAGQTAPGDGICIARNVVHLETHDVVVRHLRFRLGDEMRGELDTLQVSQSQNVILDHCSMTWSMDENCTLHGAGSRNLTVQWCVIAESLNRSYHPKGEHGHGSLLRSDGGGFSVHHCVYAHNNARNPRPGGYDDGPGLLLDFRNNVVYDWGATSGYSGLERTRLNFVGNYFKAGPSTSRAVRDYAFSAKTFQTKMFVAGNFLFGSPRKTADNSLLIRKWGEWEGEIKETNLVPEPFPAPPVTMDTAEVAFEEVLTHAGATKPKRDGVDARIMKQIRDGSGRIIDSQTEVGGWPELKSTTPPADEDRDGMPDEWEQRFGFDPAGKADGSQDKDGDGYTNIEEFLNDTDPSQSDRKELGFDFDGILAMLEASNAALREEITEEQRSRPPNTGADGSAAPPVQPMKLRPLADAGRQSVVVGLEIVARMDGKESERLFTPALSPDRGEGEAENLDLQLHWIPAGTFIMGSPAKEPERGRDETQRRVTISRPFWLGATLVTQAEFQRVMTGKLVRGREANLPVAATWPDAVRFCQALSKNTGRVFRLPTEAEWEYACRAGTATPFHTGSTISTDQANFDGKFLYPGGKPGIYRKSPTPVRTFAPNAWGLHDMHGNAYQWCSDWYGAYPEGPATDPQGPRSGNNRVIRGGRYGSGPRYIRSAARYSYNPDNSSVVFGFRVVLEAESDAPTQR